LRGEPPAITSGRRGLSRLTSAGGDHAGCTYLPSIVVRTGERRLYLVNGDGTAIRYPVAVGKAGKQWTRHHLARLRRSTGQRRRGECHGPSTLLEHPCGPRPYQIPSTLSRGFAAFTLREACSPTGTTGSTADCRSCRSAGWQRAVARLREPYRARHAADEPAGAATAGARLLRRRTQHGQGITEGDRSRHRLTRSLET
jgi:hypothetical protein